MTQIKLNLTIQRLYSRWLLSDLCRLYWALYRRLEMAELQAGEDVAAHSQDEIDGLPR